MRTRNRAAQGRAVAAAVAGAEDLLAALAGDFDRPPEGSVTARQVANRYGVSLWVAQDKLAARVKSGELTSRKYGKEMHYWVRQAGG